GCGLDHELASVIAALAEGPKPVVDRGRGGEFLAKRDGVLQAHRPAGRQVGRGGVRGIANNDRPAPVPRIWDDHGFEEGVVNLRWIADVLAEFRDYAAEGLELRSGQVNNLSLARTESLVHREQAVHVHLLGRERLKSDGYIAGGVELGVGGDLGGPGHDHAENPLAPEFRADRAKDEVPHRGMQAIGADHQVVVAALAGAERYCRSAVLLIDVRRRGGSPYLDALLGRMVKKNPVQDRAH